MGLESSEPLKSNTPRMIGKYANPMERLAHGGLCSTCKPDKICEKFPQQLFRKTELDAKSRLYWANRRIRYTYELHPWDNCCPCIIMHIKICNVNYRKIQDLLSWTTYEAQLFGSMNVM